MATFRCFDDPEGILTKPFCVSALSKDLKGKMPLRSSKKQECKEPKCVTLRTLHEMKSTVKGTNCDSGLAKSLNGGLEFGKGGGGHARLSSGVRITVSVSGRARIRSA